MTKIIYLVLINLVTPKARAKHEPLVQHTGHCGLYYKPMTILNDDARIINKHDASLTDDPRVVIYDRHMFIVQATGVVKLFSFS